MASKIKFFSRIFCYSIFSLVGVALVGAGVLCAFLEEQLPPTTILRDMQLQQPMRIYSADNKLIAEFGEKRRIPVKLSTVPPQLINAVLATEDNRFYEHNGVDARGLVRAAWMLMISGSKVQGGSTITMQLARNFFLTRNKTYIRKINEILLASKIEGDLNKDEILELYLNKIFFGHRAYGVAAAAEVYYGKELQDLTLAECAMLAGIPKAPSIINPLSNLPAALERRAHVLARMLYYGYITNDEYAAANAAPDSAVYHDTLVELYAPYVSTAVRQVLYEKFGDEIYTNGYKVYTNIDSKMQRAAEAASTKSVIEYDMRHGYRSPAAHWDLHNMSHATIVTQLQQQPVIASILKPAVITVIRDNALQILLANDSELVLQEENYKWTKIKNPEQIWHVGDVIHVRFDENLNNWQIAQVPQIEAALIAMNPQTGAIKSLTGGFDYALSQFNRVTQARRQIGSTIKPFLYSAAFAQGYTAANIINDAPIVIQDPIQDTLWRPQNSTRHFYGPTRLRVGFIQSRNVVAIRLLDSIGLRYARNYIAQFGFDLASLPQNLSLALGTASYTPLDIARAYSVFANGGFIIQPQLINKVLDSKGQVIFTVPAQFACYKCLFDPEFSPSAAELQALQEAKQIISPQNAFLMQDLMQDVIKHGTARQARILNRIDLAGKTGTTSDNVDAWFAGFNNDLVTITWMGFDEPRSLHEYAANSALPMWMTFMQATLAGKPSSQLAVPPGITAMKIDPLTGNLATNMQTNAIDEYFADATVPGSAIVNNESSGNTESAISAQTVKDTHAEQIF